MYLSMKDVSKTFEKEIHFISCISEYTKNYTQRASLDSRYLVESEHEGFLTKEYTRYGEKFPDFLEVSYYTQSYDDDFKEMLQKCKYFKNKKSAENFVKKRTTLEVPLSDYWEYRIVSIYVDKIELFEKFTGVYDKETKEIIYLESGTHYVGIEIFLWKYLFREYLTEELFNKYKKEHFNTFKTVAMHLVSREVNYEDIGNYVNYNSLKELIATNLVSEKISSNCHLDRIPNEFHGICDKYIENNIVMKSKFGLGGKDLYKRL